VIQRPGYMATIEARINGHKEDIGMVSVVDMIVECDSIAYSGNFQSHKSFVL